MDVAFGMENQSNVIQGRPAEYKEACLPSLFVV